MSKRQSSYVEQPGAEAAAGVTTGEVPEGWHSAPLVFGPEVFEFASFGQWVARAKQLYRLNFREGCAIYESVAIDTLGRICTCGRHFKRAEDENSYPIRVYRIEVA